MAEAGFDVFLCNMRGTWYSMEHTEYDAKFDDEYWEYTMAETGMYDIPANIEVAKQVSGWDKVLYLGHSYGASQFLDGFAHRPDYFRENLLKYIGIAPCFVPEFTDGEFMIRLETLTDVYLMNILGYNHLGGKDWEEDREVAYEKLYFLGPHLQNYDKTQPLSIA